MIDSLNIEIDKDLLTNEMVEGVINRMKEPKVYNGVNGIYGYGKIDNYRIVIHETGNIYLTGSICKFFYGNNLRVIKKEQVGEALKLLSNRTGLPIEKGRIMRIDVGLNLEVENLTKYYFDCLKETSRFVKNQRDTEVRYSKESFDIVFYDKMKELRKNDPITYERNKGKKVVRIEARLRKRVRGLLGYDNNVKVVMLRSTTFYNKLQQFLVKQYEAIEKRSNLKMNEIREVSDVKNLITYNGIEKLGGLHGCTKVVLRLREDKCIDTKKVKAIKVWLKGVSQNAKNVFLENDKLVEELNNLFYGYIANREYDCVNGQR